MPDLITAATDLGSRVYLSSGGGISINWLLDIVTTSSDSLLCLMCSEDVGFRCDPMSRKLITHLKSFSCVSLMVCDPIELPLSPLERRRLCKEWINLCNWEYLYQQPLPSHQSHQLNKVTTGKKVGHAQATGAGIKMTQDLIHKVLFWDKALWRKKSYEKNSWKIHPLLPDVVTTPGWWDVSTQKLSLPWLGPVTALTCQ